MTMTEVQQQRGRAACLTLPQNAAASMLKSVSKDGDLTVNYKPEAGKKTNRRKRPHQKNGYSERKAIPFLNFDINDSNICNLWFIL